MLGDIASTQNFPFDSKADSQNWKTQRKLLNTDNNKNTFCFVLQENLKVKSKPNPLHYSMIDRPMDQVNHKLDAYWYRESYHKISAVYHESEKIKYIIPQLQKKTTYLL